MLDLTGGAVLALWNGIETARIREYNAWHTREHVVGRLCIPGMASARRYMKSGGPLPDYLTLYSLDDTAVLKSDAYRSLLENPTAWSRAMRPSFRGFMRMSCRRLLTLGGGLGGSLIALVVDEHADLRAPALQRALAKLLKEPGAVAAHVLESDRDVPDVPFTVGGDSPNFPRAGAILIESYDDDELSRVVPDILASLTDLGLDKAGTTLTTYRLAYALERASLEHLAPIEHSMK